jgi:hypothetical protein
MEKLIYGGLLLALVGIGVIGCKKETITQDSREITPEFEASKNLVSFKSIESYENFIDNYEEEQKEIALEKLKKSNFQNYFKKEENLVVAKNDFGTDSDDYEMDEILGQLLNQDGAIRIGDYLFKVNLQLEEVRAVPFTDTDSYSERLALINSSSKDVMVYSIDQDILELVNGGIEKKCGGIGGGDYVTSVVDFGNNIRCQGMVRHFRAGIYFRTTARFQPLVNGVIQTNLRVQSPQAWARRRPCNSGSVITSPANIKVSGTTQQLWQFYSGTRNLNGLYLFVRVECTYMGQTLNSTWGGRNVNSPY